MTAGAAIDTIRAVRLQSPGEPLSVEDVELPEPGADEVRVEIEFAGINPVDMYAAEGRVAPDAPRPRTLGSEASGRVGDRAVFVGGGGLGTGRDGVWASAAVVPKGAVYELPAELDQRAAAAMGVAGLTAWKVVHDVARLDAGEPVVVLGASGGVGSMIVSLAKAAGATVWGQTGSEDKVSFIAEQGADRVVVCDADGLFDEISELEPSAVFDPLGGGFVDPSVRALAAHGRIVSFGTSAAAETSFDMQQLYRKGASIRGYAGLLLTDDERRAGLDRAFAALRDGSLEVRVDDVVPLDQVDDAFERIRSRRVRGKLLLEP